MTPDGFAEMVRAWCVAPEVGILLVGDAALRERAVTELVAAADRPVRRISVGADPGQWSAGDDGEAITLCVAADLLDPLQTSALAGTACPLASAESVDEVPEAVLDRCALVVDLAHSRDGLLRWQDPLLPDHPTASGPVDPLASVEVVQRAFGHGLRCHPVEIGATRIARVLAEQGIERAGALRLLDRFVFTPRSGIDQPPPPSTEQSEEPGDRPEQSRAEDEQQPDRPDREAEDSPPEDDPDPHGSGEPSGEEPSTDGSMAEDPAESETAEPEPLPVPTAGVGMGRGRHRSGAAPTGRGGPITATRVGGRAGRVVSSPRPDTGFALGATLQRVAARSVAAGGSVAARAEDLRWAHRRRRSGRLTVIVVDASGSMGRDALRQAKAIALGLLDQAYRRRDRVAVVLVRGRRAQLGLAPTKSLARVRASLRRLPHGGGTPLASGLLMADELARSWDPAAVEVVVLTDGRANIGLSSDDDAAAASQDPRQRARADAVRVAGLLHHSIGSRVVHGISRTGTADPAGWLREALQTVP